MARWRDSTSRTASSTRLIVQRAVTVLLIITALTLITLSRLQNPSVLSVRMAVLEGLSPLFEAMGAPVKSWHRLEAGVTGVFTTHRENQRLKRENDTLRHWQSVAMALRAENQALRTLMQYQPVEGATYISAKVTGQLGGTFRQGLLINAGREEGVQLYQAVVDAHGLIGRVVTMSDHSAEVLLMTDVTSRIPVISASSRDRGILVGTGGEMMQLAFLSPNHQMKVGDMVVTTEDGGLMPPSILVGTIFSITKGTVLVRPLRPADAPEFVRIVQHSAQ
jgi:rod shape-determining protein MreC